MPTMHDSDELRAKLAAAELSNKQLRETLQWYVDEDDVIETMPGNEYWVNGLNRARELLAQQPSTEALDAYVAKEVAALQAKVEELQVMVVSSDSYGADRDIEIKELRARVDAAINEESVEWVVNDSAELGVKIGNQFFFMYKGRSLVYEDAMHDNGTPMMWRHIFKREFGECCHPVNYADPTKWGTVDLDDSDDWMPLP